MSEIGKADKVPLEGYFGEPHDDYEPLVYDQSQAETFLPDDPAAWDPELTAPPKSVEDGRVPPKGSRKFTAKRKKKDEGPTSRLDIGRALTTTPSPRDFALPCLRIGTVGGLVSPGGAGKSMLSMQLALAVATGVDTLGGLFRRPGWESVKTGGVFYASFEDGPDDAATRLHAIWQAIGKKATSEALERARENLAVETLTGLKPPDLLDGGEWSQWLDKASVGRRLVILDTLRTSHMADENDAAAMSRLLATLQGAALRNSTAVMFLHHTSKAATLSGQGNVQQAARGSSVLSDNARGQYYLTGVGELDCVEDGRPLRDIDLLQPLDGHDEEGRPNRLRYARFGVSKSNYSAPWPQVWLRRDERGVLSCANVGPVQGSSAARQKTKGGQSGGRLA